MDGKRCSDVFLTGHGHFTAHFIDNAEAHRKPQSRSFADGFGGKKRGKDLLEVFGTDAAAIVMNFNLDVPVFRRAGFDPD